MRACACGCGRSWRPLNPRRVYHPECDGKPVTRRYVRKVVPVDPKAERAQMDADAGQVAAMLAALRARRRFSHLM